MTYCNYKIYPWYVIELWTVTSIRNMVWHIHNLNQAWVVCHPGHYTDEYTHYPGNMLEMDSASTSKAATVDLCAEQCSRSTAFNCLSFDFCHSTNDCMLRQVHVYDVPQSSMKNSTLCDHYSSKQSFTWYSHVTIIVYVTITPVSRHYLVHSQATITLHEEQHTMWPLPQ